MKVATMLKRSVLPAVILAATLYLLRGSRMQMIESTT